MTTGTISLDSPLEAKIVWAYNSYRRFGKHLLEDKVTAASLETLRGEIQASHREMHDAGFIDICRRCDREEGGSCCGAGIENRFDGILLLINLLLGTALPSQPTGPQICFFLGKDGCLLQARHVICVNYLCKRITDRIDSQRITTLREKEGLELETLFLLSERVKSILSKLKV